MLALVDYTSDSDSESEQKQSTPSPPQSQPQRPGLSALLPKPKGARKAAGGGGEDNNPKKIIVNLPKFKDNEAGDRPPAKRTKIGGGSGLSSMLPAPKRSGAITRNAPPSPPPPTPPSAPPVAQETHNVDEGTIEKVEEDQKQSLRENEGVNRSTRFVPQSVARKPIQPTSSFKHSGAIKSTASKSTATKQKISLFGAGPSLSSSKKSTTPIAPGEYQPIMLTVTTPANKPKGTSGAQDENSYFEEANGAVDPEPNSIDTSVENAPQDLETIAREAGLDDAAMRQLYGRRGRGNAPINITNYSVDQEYNNNELSRSMGCTIAKGCFGRRFCPREEEQERSWLQVWMVNRIL
ncbi:hypothetical protein DFP73DRAFT_472445 [Morchella snyderi]|nr:hypothetical protein DFP73DRAFT_472445 [Morchella snyderi]